MEAHLLTKKLIVAANIAMSEPTGVLLPEREFVNFILRGTNLENTNRLVELSEFCTVTVEVRLDTKPRPLREADIPFRVFTLEHIDTSFLLGRSLLKGL